MKRVASLGVILWLLASVGVGCGESDGQGSQMPGEVTDKLASMVLTEADLPPPTPRGPVSLEDIPSSQEFGVTFRQVREDLAKAMLGQESGRLEADDHCSVIDTVTLYDYPERAQEALEHTIAAPQGTIARIDNFTIDDTSKGPIRSFAVHFRVHAVLAHVWVTSIGDCYSQGQVLDLARKMEQRILDALSE
jgi:hypothetical protein